MDATSAALDRLLAAEEFLLTYRRYFSPRQLGHRLFRELNECRTHSRFLGCLRLLDVWLRSRFDVGVVDRDKRLYALIDDKRRFDAEDVRDEMNRVLLSLICSRAAARRRRLLWSDAHGLRTESERCRIWTYRPNVIAEMLTRLDHELFAAIPISEFRDNAWTRPDGALKAPKLRAYIARGNRIADWVATNILAQNAFPAQSKAFSRFVAIAWYCKDLGNFAGCASIVAGCECSDVSRLHGYWGQYISRNIKILFNALRNGVCNSANNFTHYRQAFKRRFYKDGAPCVPNLAVILRDLVYIEENPDSVPDPAGTGLQVPNVKKLDLLRETLSVVRQTQLRAYPQASHELGRPELRARLLLLPAKDADWIRERSNRMRPSPSWVSDAASTSSPSSEIGIAATANNSCCADDGTEASVSSNSSSGSIDGSALGDTSAASESDDTLLDFAAAHAADTLSPLSPASAGSSPPDFRLPPSLPASADDHPRHMHSTTKNT
jgi:hypothetical protein